jgi:CheY-like chemotaxis protein
VASSQTPGDGKVAIRASVSQRIDQPSDSIIAPILVVDDHEANLVTMRAILADLNQPVVCASSGQEALRWLLKQDFALILLDVFMPELDGYETAAMIRGREKSRRIPIIFLSAANKDQAHLFKGYSAGAVDYVFKPVAPEILRSKVSVFIELHTKIAEVRRQAELEKELMAENLVVREQQSKTALALERSQAQQSVIISSLPIVLYTARQKDEFQTRRIVGGNLENLCGYPPQEFSRSRKAWRSSVHPDDLPNVLYALSLSRQTGNFSAEYRWRCADGSYRWFSDRGTVVGGENGAGGEMFGLWLDISQRRNLEQQLAHAQKIEAIGQMTGGIAHDFNNMLSVILGSLESISADGVPDRRTRRRLDLALQAAKSCADLTRRLLGFARRQALEPAPLILAKELARLKSLLDRTIGEKVTIELDCPEDTWPIFVDHSQFEALVVNLAINARDAMPKGGTLRIWSRNQVVDEADVAELDIVAGEYAEIAVADTGLGMSEETRRRAFEPFFTTKGANKGTGLGLSTIHGFVKQSGGAVELDSELGKGTTIRLLLPRFSADRSTPLRARSGSAEASQVDLSDQVILVVDDDEDVREVVALMLKDLACGTIVAADADEALERLDTDDTISLVLTDCRMDSSMDGPALAREIMKRRPHLPILLTSAYVDSVEIDTIRSDKCTFLAKPFSAVQLATALSELRRHG